MTMEGVSKIASLHLWTTPKWTTPINDAMLQMTITVYTRVQEKFFGQILDIIFFIRLIRGSVFNTVQYITKYPILQNIALKIQFDLYAVDLYASIYGN